MNERILLPHNILLKLEYDTDPTNPREWANLGTFVHWHRRDHYGDKHIRDTEFESFKAFLTFINKDRGEFLPVYLLDHSSQHVRTTPFGDPWDSGQVGFIYVTAEELRKEYSCKRLSKAIRAEACKVLKSEVEAYDDFINGRCYGYTVEQLDPEEVAACEGDEDAIRELDGKHLDSCWGFYGEDYFRQTAMESAQYYVNKIEALGFVDAGAGI